MILNLGIPSHSYPLDWVDKYSGTLIICAGGRNVFTDFQQAIKRHRPKNPIAYMTVNDITMHLPARVDHVYSNDDRWLPKWVAARRELLTKEFGGEMITHTNRGKAQVSWPWPGSGSSGLGAVYTGLALGYDNIVLCGMPLDDSGHYFDAPWRQTNFVREVPLKGNGQIKYWQQAKDEVFQGKVTSMSGRTKELLK